MFDSDLKYFMKNMLQTHDLLYFYFQGKLNIQNVWKEKVFTSFKKNIFLNWIDS